jgi:hypothetical protein
MGLLSMIGPSGGQAGYNGIAIWEAVSVLEQLQHAEIPVTWLCVQLSATLDTLIKYFINLFTHILSVFGKGFLSEDPRSWFYELVTQVASCYIPMKKL